MKIPFYDQYMMHYIRDCQPNPPLTMRRACRSSHMEKFSRAGGMKISYFSRMPRGCRPSCRSGPGSGTFVGCSRYRSGMTFLQAMCRYRYHRVLTISVYRVDPHDRQFGTPWSRTAIHPRSMENQHFPKTLDSCRPGQRNPELAVCIRSTGEKTIRDCLQSP